jgi:curli biogenesis system outer membrane secretion channel CsgG
MKLIQRGALAALLAAPLVAYAQPVKVAKPMVSVNPVEDLANTGQAAILHEMMETSIINTGRFRIMERGDHGMGQMVKEQQLAKSGMVTSNTPGKIGGFEGVDFIVYGAITAGGTNTKQNIGASMGMDAAGSVLDRTLGFGLGGAFHRNSDCHDNSATLAVDIRITDAKTGEIRHAKHVTQVQDGGTTCGGRSQADISALLRSAAQDVAVGLTTAMYPVKVVNVGDDGQLYLNYGEGLLYPGDVYAIFSQGHKIFNDNGEELGNDEKLLGLIRVTEVLTKMSKATIAAGFAGAPPSVGAVARLATPEQIQAMSKRR